MSARYALYFAPARDSLLGLAAQGWLVRPELAGLTVSARRYGFHATLRSPMHLKTELAELEALLPGFAAQHRAVRLDGLAPRLLGGFLALTVEPEPKAVTDLAAAVITTFEALRAPLSTKERQRRFETPLTARQSELVEAYGYPYVLEQFKFHMTLTDRMADAGQQAAMAAEAARWFAPALAEPVLLDRLVIFEEAGPGAAFRRLDRDYMLLGA